MAEDSTESLRRSFRPDQVRLLLVGESRPAGPTFFYSANSNLYRTTREAFARVYERDWSTGAEFLEFFKALGCYLDDLCLEPIDDKEDMEREEARRQAVSGLAERIRKYAPLAIASVMRGIHEHVTEAAARGSGGTVTVASLPFPRQRHEPRYTRELEALLHRLIDEGVLLLGCCG